MLPAFCVTVLHLRLEKTPELAGYSPSNTIPLLDPTLNYVFVMRQTMNVYPHTLVQNFICYHLCVIIFNHLSAPSLTPKAIAGPICMLAKSTRANRKL